MNDLVESVRPLGFPWEAQDPFLFCVHHEDHYPAGNAQLGPNASLAGRDLGQDFAGKDGWRMYHGTSVPGFPQHPHRGFETVTLVRTGYIDHSDSLGATARFGSGDVQWLTAGQGIVHSEMFPLVKPDAPNPLELFQIWLNLPRVSKLVEPHFATLWNEQIPDVVSRDPAGRTTEMRLVAGRFGAVHPPTPPPHSWAARAESEVAIWTIKLAPGAQWTLPATTPGTNRTLYFFKGVGLRVAGNPIPERQAIRLRSSVAIPLENGPLETELLLLQGRPIGEPLAQHGPFVMNTPAEIQQAFADYRRTHFGGWPWPSDDPVHPRAETRFAKHADGRLDRLPDTSQR